MDPMGMEAKLQNVFFISRCSMVMPRSCNVIEIDSFD